VRAAALECDRIVEVIEASAERLDGDPAQSVTTSSTP